MTFESQSGSGSQKICDLFARFIERTYADKPWVPSDGCQVDSIYTDFSNAFNKVRHRWLLDKMSTDVEPSRCQWLGSYFSGRIQRVKIGDCVSRDILVTSGVSQGSHLGPLCFIWFVNEIAWIFRHVRVLFYAGDMKLFLPVRDFRVVRGQCVGVERR
jgi:hypothetical protein